MHLSVIKILRLLNSKPKQYLKETEYSILVAICLSIKKYIWL